MTVTLLPQNTRMFVAVQGPVPAKALWSAQRQVSTKHVSAQALDGHGHPVMPICRRKPLPVVSLAAHGAGRTVAGPWGSGGSNALF